ncbi:hypothetical protein Tco_0945143 [Tanacetum coccineum]
MHIRASNSEVVEPLPEPERTLNQRLRRRNRRVPFEQRNAPPTQPKVVYALILDINYFCHFLDILENYNLVDDELMWVADRVVASTPGSAITIPETVNELAIKGNHLTLVKGNQFDGRIKTDPHKHIHEFLRICDMFKYKDTKNEVVRLMMFPLSLTGEAKTWLDELNEGTIETSLPSNTQPNPKGSSSKPYQPPQARNEHVNAVLTPSGKSYDPPINPNDQPNDSRNPINFDSDDEDEEPTPQPKVKAPKPVKETPILKPYKPKIPYPQCLRKEKMEAQYGKFLNMIRAVRINVPLFDVLAGMLNYGKFLKELVSNKHKLEQISSALFIDKSSAMIQNKVPPKLGDPGSFIIPCNFSKAFSCNALADLAENMLVKVGKFTFPMDFVILKMEENSKVPLILRRSILYTADAVIRVKQKQLNLGVGTERIAFSIDSKKVIDEILEEYFDALLD